MLAGFKSTKIQSWKKISLMLFAASEFLLLRRIYREKSKNKIYIGREVVCMLFNISP